MKKLFFIIGIFIFFSQNIFAKKNKEYNKEYNSEICKKNIFSEMSRVEKDYKISYYKNVKEIGISLRDKSEILVFNFRTLSQNFEWICNSLNTLLFTWKINNKKIKYLDNCYTNNIKEFQWLIKYCQDSKDDLLYWKEIRLEKDEFWNKKREWWEYQFLEENFELDAKKDKVNFLAARIYDLNRKIRKILLENMNRLKTNIVNIVNRITCTQK